MTPQERLRQIAADETASIYSAPRGRPMTGSGPSPTMAEHRAMNIARRSYTPRELREVVAPMRARRMSIAKIALQLGITRDRVADCVHRIEEIGQASGH